MSECSKYRELICSLVDEELNKQTRDALLSHIDRCGECKALFDAFSALSVAVSEDIEEVPEALHENIMAGVRRSALRNKNKKRSVRHTKSLLAAAACFAVVIMSAVGISKTMESRKGDVINDVAAVKAEARVAEDAADAAVTVEAAPESVQQADATTPTPMPDSTVNPVSTPVPPVVESTEEIDEFGGMRGQSGETDATASPVQSGVKGIEIPDAQISDEPAEPAAQPQSETQTPFAENADSEPQSEDAAAYGAVGAQPEVNAAAADTQPAELPETVESAQDEAAAAAGQSGETGAQPAKPGNYSGGLRGLFSGLTPAATNAPETGKLPEADVYFEVTGDKDYEELSNLLLGTLSKLPIEKADRTYLVSIVRGEKPIVLIIRAYGDKLFYSIYDEFILQNVMLADCKPEALEKFMRERAKETAAVSETGTGIEAEEALAPAEQTPAVKINVGA